MAENRIILVTGVAGYWGARVAAQLADAPDFHVIGLDTERPKEAIKDLDFIQADVRNPLLVDLLETEQVDTVCHLTFVDSAKPSEAAFDVNVMGTMKVLGACAEASSRGLDPEGLDPRGSARGAGVRKVVLKSSMAVYGARPDNPAFLTEDHSLRGSRRYGYTRDMVEIEKFCNGFRRQVPEMMLTTLRFASIVGPTVDTPMTHFLREPWTPVLLGFDPMMQVIHEDDVTEALVHAVINDVPGVFNVAAEEVLPLTRIMGLAGRFPFPVLHPFAYWGTSLPGGVGSRLTRYVPIELDYIRYPWVGDLTKMREELGFYPHYTAEEALREFAGQQRKRRYLPESAALAYDEKRLRDTIERRRRARERQASITSVEEEGEDNE